MGRVNLMPGVTVSDKVLNILGSSWPTQHEALEPRPNTTLDESVVRAAEEAKIKFGLVPFPRDNDYFEALSSIGQGDSPLAAVIIHSQEDTTGYVPENTRSTRRYDSALASRHRHSIRSFPAKKDAIHGRDTREMHPDELYSRGSRRHQFQARAGVVVADEIPYENLRKLPRDIVLNMLSEYSPQQADFIVGVVNQSSRLGIVRMLDEGVFVPDMRHKQVYFISNEAEAALAEHGLRPDEFHKYAGVRSLQYVSSGKGLIVVIAPKPYNLELVPQTLHRQADSLKGLFMVEGKYAKHR